MHPRWNLASVLIRVRGIHDHPVTVSTDGHRVRLLMRGKHFETVWCYADLDPDSADALALALTRRYRPRRGRSLLRQLGWRSRR